MQKHISAFLHPVNLFSFVWFFLVGHKLADYTTKSSHMPQHYPGSDGCWVAATLSVSPMIQNQVISGSADSM